MAASNIEEWRSDLLEVWRALPSKQLFLVLLAALLVLFQFLGNSTLGYVSSPSLLGWWFGTLMQGAGVQTQGGVVGGQGSAVLQVLSSEEGFALVIPVVVVGLLWWKRGELMALPKRI